MQFETHLRARVPRSNCKSCGVKTTRVPWADKHSRFTVLFEAFAIAALKACGTISGAKELLGIGWDAAHRIMERAVERGLERRELESLEYVVMDEKSFGKGQGYISLPVDLSAWAVKEQFRWFWDYRYAGNARKFFSKWYGQASRSRLRPIIQVGKILKRYPANTPAFVTEFPTLQRRG
jgi:transposase